MSDRVAVDEFSYFSVEMHTELSEPAGDPTDCITRFHGKIWLHTEDSRSQVGRFEILELDVDQSDFSPFDVLDCDACTAIYLDMYDHSRFSKKVLRLLDDEDSGGFDSLNVLLIERFEILPKARGTGLAPKVLNYLIGKLGRNCRIAALIPYPLQFSIGDTGDAFSKRMKYDDIAGDVEAGERKLRKFYSSAGFVRIPGSDVMIRDLFEELETVGA